MNCLSNDFNWAGSTGWNDTHCVLLPENVDLEPLSENELANRSHRRDLLVTGTALTALLYAILTAIMI